MALLNSSLPPLMDEKLEGKWWTILSSIGSGKRVPGNLALQSGPQVKIFHPADVSTLYSKKMFKGQDIEVTRIFLDAGNFELKS